MKNKMTPSDIIFVSRRLSTASQFFTHIFKRQLREAIVPAFPVSLQHSPELVKVVQVAAQVAYVLRRSLPLNAKRNAGELNSNAAFVYCLLFFFNFKTNNAK
jgi:hypothetical protein